MSNKRILETPTEPCAQAVGVFHRSDKQVVSSPFENRQYVHPDSLSSTMSPAAYLADLYEMVGGKNGALGQRRPDLAGLPLTPTSLNEEVMTLSIANEALSEQIVNHHDDISDQAELTTKMDSANTPLLSIFERDHHFVRLGLEALNGSYQEVMQVFQPLYPFESNSNPLMHPSSLGLSPKQWEALARMLFVPPAPFGVPVAVGDWWTSDSTMYYWSDGTQSEFSSFNKAFYRNVHGFDARGVRPSDYSNQTTGSWPTNRQLAGAEGRMLFWDNNTFHYFKDEAGNFVLDLTKDPLPLSELGKGGNQPNWQLHKRLLGVAQAWEWLIFFWHDDTHSMFSQSTGQWATYSHGTVEGFRPNTLYNFPNDKRISAFESIEDKQNKFRIFWSDGTHSEIRNGNLTKNTDGFDEHGYRPNKVLPDWLSPSQSMTNVSIANSSENSRPIKNDDKAQRSLHALPAPRYDWPLRDSLYEAGGELCLRSVSKQALLPDFVRVSPLKKEKALLINENTFFFMDELFPNKRGTLVLLVRPGSDGEFLTIQSLVAPHYYISLAFDLKSSRINVLGRHEQVMPLPESVKGWYRIVLNLKEDFVELNINGTRLPLNDDAAPLGGQLLLCLGSGQWRGEASMLRIFDALLTEEQVNILPLQPPHQSDSEECQTYDN
nr:Tc toxin subunit A [Vibrio parahaemolyticus]